MTKKLFPSFALLVLVFATLACGALNDLSKDVKSAQATVEAAQTDTGDSGNNAEPTAKAAKPTRTPKPTKATNADQPTAEPTTEPEATTDSGNSGGDDNSVPLGQVPDDIPVLPENTLTNLFVMEGVVSYQTDVAFSEAVDFYQTEMPKNDWEVDSTATVLTSDAAVLSFKKATQTAIVTISVDASSKAVYVQVLTTK